MSFCGDLSFQCDRTPQRAAPSPINANGPQNAGYAFLGSEQSFMLASIALRSASARPIFLSYSLICLSSTPTSSPRRNAATFCATALMPSESVFHLPCTRFGFATSCSNATGCCATWEGHSLGIRKEPLALMASSINTDFPELRIARNCAALVSAT
jgi:hypothetical protein